MQKNKMRHELKHAISMTDRYELKARLKHIAKYDDHCNADGSYIVRSVYFDDYRDSDFKKAIKIHI